MARRSTGRPTDAELEILKILWDRGPSTVRAVRDVLAERRRVAYTTVLTMLQIMTDKGLVARQQIGRAHAYRARRSRSAVARQLAADMVNRLFEGSTPELVLYALEGKKATPKDLAEIRRLIDEFERRQR